MKHVLIIFASIALILTACSPAAEPTLDPAAVQGTAMAAAMTMIAETQAAMPTATPVPPTEVPTEAPTETPLPTNTPESLVSDAPTQAVSVPPTNTPIPSSGSSDDPCNQILIAWEGESVKVTLKNNTSPKGYITPWIYMQADLGECGYIPVAAFNNSTTVLVPVGLLSAGAFVEGKKDFKVFGGGRITPGSWALWIENDSIKLKAGCSPNC